jgi:hypothetical protein
MVGSIPIAAAVGTGWTPSVFYFNWATSVLFYVQTWEEFHVGAMILPPVNGPSDGIVCAAGICFLSAIVGPMWWQQPCYRLGDTQLSPFDILVAVGWLGTAVTVVRQATNVLRSIPSSSRSSALLQLASFLIYIVLGPVYVSLSPAAMSHQVACIALLCSIFVDLATHVMFQHLIGGSINPLRLVSYAAAILMLMFISYSCLISVVLERAISPCSLI